MPWKHTQPTFQYLLRFYLNRGQSGNSKVVQEGTPSFPYPPESLAKAVEALFVHGSAATPAWDAKLGLLLYCLLDAGHKSVLSTFG